MHSLPEHAEAGGDTAPTQPTIRVMHVISGLGMGGAESMLSSLATGGRRLGLDPIVVSLLPGGEHAVGLSSAGIMVDDLGMKPHRPSLRAIGRLAGLMRLHRPQVVQSWMYHADLMAWAACALLPARIRPRLVWGIRCSDMRVESYGKQLRWVIRACARLSPKPDLIIANSSTGRAVHQRLGYRNARFDVIANGIDVDRFRPDQQKRADLRAAFALEDDQIAVALIARVDPMKDHARFVAALAALPDMRGFLIGRGTDTLDLPPNVIGMGQRGDIETLLPAFDVIALSSAFGEGFPNALAEGMAAGLVPAATDVGDCRQMIGDTGFLSAPGDVGGLVDILTRAAASARNGGGAGARQRIVEAYALPRALNAFRDAYVDILRAPCAG